MNEGLVLPEPDVSPSELISMIDYGVISENQIDQMDIEAIKYYLEELRLLLKSSK